MSLHIKHRINIIITILKFLPIDILRYLLNYILFQYILNLVPALNKT